MPRFKFRFSFEENYKIVHAFIKAFTQSTKNIGMEINIPFNQVQGVVAYISDTSCKFASYNPTSGRIDIVLYGIK